MATILDTLIGQAKGTLSRAYLTSGVIPAATLLFGLRVYEDGLDGFRADLESLVKSTQSLTSGTVFGLILLAVVGGIFYGGRTLILRVLQALPGPFLAVLRHHLLMVQVDRWWIAQKRKYLDERRLTVLDAAKKKKFETPSGQAIDDESKVTDALEASRTARAHLERIAPFSTEEPWQPEKGDIEIIVSGLVAFYSLVPIDGVDPAVAERDAWVLLCADDRVCEVLAKILADVRRKLIAATAAASEQPDDDRWLAPTRLGNRVAALDDYAERRYRISTSTLWIRLWGVLDDKDRAEVTQAQLAVETLANMTAAFSVLAAVTATGWLIEGGRAFINGQPINVDWRALLFAGGSIVLARASYNVAVFTFGSVAERIIRLVDLHRVRLITGVGYPPPKTVAEEMAILEELNTFFASAKERDAGRVLTPPPSPRAPAAPGRLLGRFTR